MAEEPAAAMKDAKFSPGNERWPLMAVLTWIATRSLKVTEQLASLDPAEAGQILFDARRNCGAPLYLSYANAFSLLTEKIESHAIAGLGSKIKWTAEPTHEHLPVEQCFARSKRSHVFGSSIFDPHLLSNMNRGKGYRLNLSDFTFHDEDCLTPNGSGVGFPSPDGARERWTWKAVTFGRDDVLRLWADWPVHSAWKLARAQGWEPPRGISADWLKTLPAGQYVALSAVVDLLAFGPGRLPIGLAFLDEHAARLRAGLALVRAAADAKLTLCGSKTYRLPKLRSGIAPPSEMRKLEPGELGGMTLILDGARDWLGPKEFADQYPEIGQAPESVRFAGVTVQRESLKGWLALLSGKASKKRGPRPAYPWQKIKAKLTELMDYHGDFSPDDPEWNAQARLEERLTAFCEGECRRSPSLSQLRAQIAPWLAAWRDARK